MGGIAGHGASCIRNLQPTSLHYPGAQVGGNRLGFPTLHPNQMFRVGKKIVNSVAEFMCNHGTEGGVGRVEPRRKVMFIHPCDLIQGTEICSVDPNSATAQTKGTLGVTPTGQLGSVDRIQFTNKIRQLGKEIVNRLVNLFGNVQITALKAQKLVPIERGTIRQGGFVEPPPFPS